MQEDRTLVNKHLNAWAELPSVKNLENKELNTVTFAFYGGQEYYVPFHLLTEGYHYTHGGRTYQSVCEWIKQKGELLIADEKKRIYVKVKQSFYGREKTKRSYIGPFADMAQAVRFCAYFNEKPYETEPNESGRPDLVVVRRDRVEDAEPPDIGFAG